MIFPRFRRAARPDTISVLYGTIVAQARLAEFYRGFAVPDTINGRFELLVLHLVLLLDRLAHDEALRPLGQGIFDAFCRDMDDNLREMGVGDLAVPKKMRGIGAAYYDRAKAYGEALAAGEGALASVIARNIYGTEPAVHAPRLANYVWQTARHLAAVDRQALGAGLLDFPDPAAISEACDVKD
jgi:cytochrome b pre-mRNA-processing protein 3